MDPSPASTPLADWWAGWRDRLPRRPAMVVAALAAVAVLGLLAVLVARPAQGPPPQLTLPIAGADAPPPSPGPSTTAPNATATVHAAGALAHPGIYTVPPGARVADVVAAAGGPLPEADLDRVNLATRVADGERVHVPRKGEAASPGAGAAGAPATTTAAPAGPLDLNTATLDQLDGLPGIGPATAQAILTYRTRHGRFRSVNELVEVPGIGPSKLEAVRPLVKV